MRLTQAERRRVYLAQMAARQAMFERLQREAAVATDRAEQGRRRRVAGMLFTALLLGGGLLVWGILDFNPPTSLEALLPRL
ncbi:MAG TPA: hypothetical protein VNO23_12910 [Candidatus Binatia bacterium]|nr:hypothetical protein [Candidatus Binatia bacterium]